MLVGAGGHFCPVAKQLNSEAARTALVVAQEAEFPVPERDVSEWAPEPERPELYYCRDLKGYGWCFRKGAYLNVGLGRMDTQSLPKACARFVEFLQARRRVPRAAAWRWRGHAYLVCSPPHRRIADEGVLLVGDAAGLAYSQSGEGIRPAVESGLLAASAILASDRLAAGSAAASYIEQLRARFGFRTAAPPWRFMPDLSAALGPLLLGSSWFVRNVVLDRWFLHARDAALSSSV
jgi:flavin-dependent dehydrogenase